MELDQELYGTLLVFLTTQSALDSNHNRCGKNTHTHYVTDQTEKHCFTMLIKRKKSNF